VLANDLKAA
jgi:chromosome segregation ATPase